MGSLSYQQTVDQIQNSIDIYGISVYAETVIEALTHKIDTTHGGWKKHTVYG